MGVEAGSPVRGWEGKEVGYARPGTALRVKVTGSTPPVEPRVLVAGADVAPTPRDAWRRRLLAAADAGGIAIALVGMHAAAPASRLTLPAVVLLVGAWVLLNKLLGLYDRDDKVIHHSGLDELPKVLHSLALGSLLLWMCGPLIGVTVHRPGIVSFLVLAAVAMPAARALARTVVRSTFAPERCVILGSGPVATLMARKLEMHPEYGVELVGYLDDPVVARFDAPAAPRLGRITDLEAVAAAHRVERVIVAFSALSTDRLLSIVRQAKRSRIKVTIVPRLYEAIGHAVEVDEVEGMTVLSLRGLSRSRSSLMLKRVIDVAGASVGLLVLSPLLAAIALAIKLDSPGPVIFRQRRMGRDRDFEMLKFRSMVHGADEQKAALLHLNEADGPMFKIARDPRVTRVGRLLRKASLDELPQLVNVLRGEMSLVGPRPLVPDEDDHVMGFHRYRLDLTPGLTGPWQVSGRNRVPFEEMVKMDYLYVAEWSLWHDLRILLRTLPIVVFGRGH